MARADLQQGAPVPGQFFKYHGGQFTEPGVGGADDLIINTSAHGTFTMQPHVVYSPYLRRYVMILELGNYNEMVLNVPLTTSGIYASFPSTPLRGRPLKRCSSITS